jgi:serine O-acetyltransferase
MSDPFVIRVPHEVVNDNSVRVVSLLATTGQQVVAGQGLVELETSKSNIEIEAEVAGWLQLLCKAGDDITVGGVIGYVHDSKDELLWAFRAASVPEASAETSIVTAIATVFSNDALALMQAKGISEEVFRNRSFVRAADVKSLGEGAPPDSVTQSKDEADVSFEQTFGDDWPLLALIRSDVHRIGGRHDNATILHQWWWNPGFNFVFWFRIAQWARRRAWTKVALLPVILLILYRRHLQSGIRIPLSVEAGPGLLIAHWGGIWINPQCRLGANCTLSNDINAGSAGGAGTRGVPQIGNNVYVGPGSRLAGPIRIGQNAAIMPNTLVTSDVQPNSIVIGVPHRVSGRLEKNNFVSNTDYPRP